VHLALKKAGICSLFFWEVDIATLNKVRDSAIKEKKGSRWTATNSSVGVHNLEEVVKFIREMWSCINGPPAGRNYSVQEHTCGTAVQRATVSTWSHPALGWQRDSKMKRLEARHTTPAGLQQEPLGEVLRPACLLAGQGHLHLNRTDSHSKTVWDGAGLGLNPNCGSSCKLLLWASAPPLCNGHRVGTP
jgi:hypothetical protein